MFRLNSVVEIFASTSRHDIFQMQTSTIVFFLESVCVTDINISRRTMYEKFDFYIFFRLFVPEFFIIFTIIIWSWQAIIDFSLSFFDKDRIVSHSKPTIIKSKNQLFNHYINIYNSRKHKRAFLIKFLEEISTFYSILIEEKKKKRKRWTKEK